MIDEDTFTVGYDEKRGEPRGKAGLDGVGDCINCFQCVRVCPTGIDIRQGLQMECVGCFNCVDACADVMLKIGKKPGLVRYDSFNGFSGLKRRVLRPRVALYGVLFILGFSAMIFSATRYSGGSMTVTRMVGEPFFIKGEKIRNQYQIRLVNKRNNPVAYKISVDVNGKEAEFNGISEPVTVSTDMDFVRPVVVSIPKVEFDGCFPITIRAESEDGKMHLSREVIFLGPDVDLLK